MTTYTKLAYDEQPSLSINPSHKLNKINGNIYGGFIEHMGRCIYGGIYDPENPNTSLIDDKGFRKDVIEAMKELSVPVARHPGGNCVATYHWLDGVGPPAKRPKRPELAWRGTESNQFGTDEFMQWCHTVGTEPYLALNVGTSRLMSRTSQQARPIDLWQAHLTKASFLNIARRRGFTFTALTWLEYCNSSQNTHYANLRRQNGREQPYNVKYWALGNECWGPWQVEQMTKEDYSKKAYQWAKALKLQDPSITLISCGETGYSSWDFHVLKECVKLDLHCLGGSTTMGLIDIHSIHIYTASGDDPVKNALAPRLAERAIEICAGLIDLSRIENKVPPTVPRQTICFDEWNVWDPQRAPDEKGTEEQYTLSDALAVAIWLNVFVRQRKWVGMANVAQSVNVISPLMTMKDGLIKQTTWWPLLLFSKYMRGSAIATYVSCSAYQGPTEPAWLEAMVKMPWLDVAATVDEIGWVSLVVVNTHLTEAFKTGISTVESSDQIVKVFTITGERWDVVNSIELQAVGIQESKWDGIGKFTFPNFSMTMLRWKYWS